LNKFYIEKTTEVFKHKADIKKPAVVRDKSQNIKNKSLSLKWQKVKFHIRDNKRINCRYLERIHCPNNGVMSEKCIKQWRIHSNCRFLERIHCPNNGVMSEKCIKQWRIHSNCRFRKIINEIRKVRVGYI
jgi:hypothetical protein